MTHFKKLHEFPLASSSSVLKVEFEIRKFRLSWSNLETHLFHEEMECHCVGSHIMGCLNIKFVNGFLLNTDKTQTRWPDPARAILSPTTALAGPSRCPALCSLTHLHVRAVPTASRCSSPVLPMAACCSCLQAAAQIPPHSYLNKSLPA